jgi:hypothetical protein
MFHPAVGNGAIAASARVPDQVAKEAKWRRRDIMVRAPFAPPFGAFIA